MSPYSYLAATQLAGLCARTQATARWVPVYLPGIMRATGNRGPAELPVKAVYLFKDVNDWAKHYGLPELLVPEKFPFQAAAANRLCLAALEQGSCEKLALHLYRAIWSEQRDANDPAVLQAAAKAVGLEVEPLVARAQSDEIRERLKANTDAAVERGAFGVPTFFVEDEMFVGNDRLMFVEKALKR